MVSQICWLFQYEYVQTYRPNLVVTWHQLSRGYVFFPQGHMILWRFFTYSYHTTFQRVRLKLLLLIKKHEATCIEFTNTSFQTYNLEMMNKNYISNSRCNPCAVMSKYITVTLFSTIPVYFEWMNHINHICIYHKQIYVPFILPVITKLS